MCMFLEVSKLDHAIWYSGVYAHCFLISHSYHILLSLNIANFSALTRCFDSWVDRS